jgi:hypothetical protein
VTDRLIRITTALAVVAVAVVAAIISYQHAYELVPSHGDSGVTARLLPFTVDGLIWAASMVVLDASRRNLPVPAAGRVEPGRGHRGHGQRQPGARRRARPGQRIGQRMNSPLRRPWNRPSARSIRRATASAP